MSKDSLRVLRELNGITDPKAEGKLPPEQAAKAGHSRNVDLRVIPNKLSEKF